MRRWEDSTFVFISTNPEQFEGGAEEHWIPVMQALAAKGASVRFLTPMGSVAGEKARELPGIAVDPYILDKWNLVRSHTRLRKYLKRYVPVAAHSTGLEADLLLRWAARKVPETRVVHTIGHDPQGTRRRRPVDALMRRFDEVGMRSAAAVFVADRNLYTEVIHAGVSADRVIVDAVESGEPSETVRLHLETYRYFMAGRGAAG